jgi:hypothetical protein
MVASIVPQNGAPKSQNCSRPSAAGTVERYEIKWKKIMDGRLVIIRSSGAGTTGTGQRAAGGGQASILAVVSQLFDDKIKVSFWKIGKFFSRSAGTRLQALIGINAVGQIAIDRALVVYDALGYLLYRLFDHYFVMVGKSNDRVRRCLQGLYFFDIDHHNGIV